MSYNAVIFDLDGTLLDTLDDLADSMNAALAEAGFTTHPTEAYKTFVGDGMDKLARRTLPPESRTDTQAAKMLAAMREKYAIHWADKTKPYPGICEMLSALEKHGLKMNILSNKPDDFTKLCVDRFLGDYKFDIIQGVADDCPPKPDPTGAKNISQRLELAVENILYLGDTNTDMLTANAAGMHAVGVTWGFRSAEELKANGAKTLIDHPSKLLNLL
jgi:phosphoglycolate phosphatase